MKVSPTLDVALVDMEEENVMTTARGKTLQSHKESTKLTWHNYPFFYVQVVFVTVKVGVSNWLEGCEKVRMLIESIDS